MHAPFRYINAGDQSTMDITDDSVQPMSSPTTGEERPLQTPQEQSPLEPLDLLDLPEPLARLSPELAQSLADASKLRQAKIRALQKAMKHGTYGVSAEQIADTMLRNTLLDDLP
jgi:anti-sigma-28 factor FlgM